MSFSYEEGLPTPGVCTAAPQITLDSFQYFGYDGAATGFFKKVNPVSDVISNSMDITAALHNGKNIFLVNSFDNTFTITNPPMGVCSEKVITVKNTSGVSLQILGPIEGSLGYNITGNSAVQLVWSDTNNIWLIIGFFDYV